MSLFPEGEPAKSGVPSAAVKYEIGPQAEQREDELVARFEICLRAFAETEMHRRRSSVLTDADFENAYTHLVTPPGQHVIRTILGNIATVAGGVLMAFGVNLVTADVPNTAGWGLLASGFVVAGLGIFIQFQR